MKHQNIHNLKRILTPTKRHPTTHTHQKKKLQFPPKTTKVKKEEEEGIIHVCATWEFCDKWKTTQNFRHSWCDTFLLRQWKFFRIKEEIEVLQGRWRESFYTHRKGKPRALVQNLCQALRNQLDFSNIAIEMDNDLDLTPKKRKYQNFPEIKERETSMKKKTNLLN